MREFTVFSISMADPGESSGLQPPLRPNTGRTSSGEDEFRGSLSDYSDYGSSDEETRDKTAPSSSNGYSERHTYPGSSDVDASAKSDEEDPFADPFGDSHGVDDPPSTRGNGKQRVW